MKSRRLALVLLTVGALLLAACGGGAPAAEPTAAPAQATPTFEPVQDAEPTVGAAPEPTAAAAPTAAAVAPTAPAAPAAAGTLAWRDQVLRNDEVVVSVTGLPAPPAGQVYAAWLGGADGSLPLGKLSLGSDPATLTFVSPANQNLLGAYSQVYITQAAEAEAEQNNQNVVLAGALPEKALLHIRHVLFSIGNTPNKIGFALGMRQETDELQRHAQFLNDSLTAGDFRLVKLHAEHIANIIEGSEAHDLDGDGKVLNPGDGFGLLPNGQQDGYIKGMVDHAKLAAESPDATDQIKVHAEHVQIAGANTQLRIQDIHDRADKIAEAGGIADTQQDVLKIVALAQQTIQGVDVNLDEQIGPIAGEGGVLTAYQHAQLMAGVALAPGQAAAPDAAVAQPAAAPEKIAVDIADNTFSPNKITVPVGATVVWTHKGQKPHTVTADDGAFSSGKLDAGGAFEQTFDKPGTFPYFCEFHGGKGGEGMAATIIVAAQSAAAPAAAPAPAPAPAPAAGGTEVAIGDNTFTPKELSVPVGATVVWKHDGQRKHTVTADDNSFNSGTLEAGGNFSQTFDKPGTYAYFCEFHGGAGGGGMAGVIKVGDAAPAAVAPPPQPTAAPAPPPAAAVTAAMIDFDFDPKELRIKVGTTVTWKNNGAAPHSATAVDKSFDTTVFQPGDSKSVTFSTAGTFAYYCSLHGTPDGKNGMVATVVVE